VNRPLPQRAAAAACLLLALAAWPAAARAGNKADAFEGKIQPISGQLYRTAGRLELTPLGDLSLNDAFFTKYFGGLKATWHFTEFLSLGASFEGGTATRSGSAVVCPPDQGCHPATTEQLYQVPGKLSGVASLEAGWTPVYGKLNVMSEAVGHFDLSLLGGVDLVLRKQVLSADQAIRDGLTPASQRSIGAHLGLGARIFLTEAIALRWEVRDLVYVVDVPNKAGSGQGAAALQNQLFTSLGVSVFFPFQASGGAR
jgi:outer membrane beta-barrel protein